jgi:hypothetical protein
MGGDEKSEDLWKGAGNGSSGQAESTWPTCNGVRKVDRSPA